MTVFVRQLLIAMLVMLSVAPVYAMTELPDPTRPGNFMLQSNASDAQLSQHFQLHSVLISSQRRVAIINDKSVEVGDWVDGASVKSINKNRVELVKQGSRFSVVLTENDFKQRK